MVVVVLSSRMVMHRHPILSWTWQIPQLWLVNTTLSLHKILWLILWLVQQLVKKLLIPSTSKLTDMVASFMLIPHLSLQQGRALKMAHLSPLTITLLRILDSARLLHLMAEYIRLLFGGSPQDSANLHTTPKTAIQTIKVDGEIWVLMESSKRVLRVSTRKTLT